MEVPEGCPLTWHEYRTLTLFAAGLRLRQVAAVEGRSPNTISARRTSLKAKINAVNMNNAVAIAATKGWI
ncbi:MAG: LuxR C-terminal-related transcriptional regulator [Gammaproteobacteria bacterium]|nr:LuxR C-terminal-related transcriptional regulator [Gammaproteobacteria bacterium]